jgi:hypothetical protein
MDDERPAQEVERMVDELVGELRLRCLWFLRPDYWPATDEERLQVLNYIQRHGDRAAFLKAAEAKRWLLRRCSERSASS